MCSAAAPSPGDACFCIKLDTKSLYSSIHAIRVLETCLHVSHFHMTLCNISTIKRCFQYLPSHYLKTLRMQMSTAIELTVLVLTVPCTVVAVVSIWVLIFKNQSSISQGPIVIFSFIAPKIYFNIWPSVTEQILLCQIVIIVRLSL